MDKVRQLANVLTGEEEAALNGLLEANGLVREQLYAEQITHLEMFLHDYPRMMCLHLFPYLKSLCLIHQEIKEICNLEECVHLEKLWVVENELTDIKGLDGLTNLRELYLYSNKLRSIRNLEHLTNLEVLWLSDNQISSLEGLSTLGRLRELNMARNDIGAIGEALLHNTALEVLNFADNALGSFKDVRPLTRLPRLVDLCFADPMWGDCPLAGLCNYQTFVLFMLPRLTSLDTLLLAEETKQLAEATYLKKQMYYNMRIKTMHRNARNIIKLANEGRKTWAQFRAPLIAQLVLQQKEITRALEEAEHYASPGAPPKAVADAAGEEGGEGGGGQQPATAMVKRVSGAEADALRAKLSSINEHLAQHSQELAEADTNFEECAGRTYQVVDAYVGRMLLELETAGNIRLEEGKPSDLWYSSCVDLVASRFNASDYDASLGVTGLTVTGVTRIHNRWLRNRFEKQLGTLVDTGDGGYKKSMEYLFLGEHPLLGGEMDRIVEGGLRAPAAMAAMGLDAAVLLSNNVHLADQLRLQAMVEARSILASGGPAASALTSQSLVRMEQPASGRIMIVKVYLGRTSADPSPVLTNRFQSTAPRLFMRDGRLNAAACVEGLRMDRAPTAQGSSEPLDAVYRSRGGDSKQRLWYIFDHVMVLPEYLIEFQYELSPTSVKLARSPGPLQLHHPGPTPSQTSDTGTGSSSSSTGVDGGGAGRRGGAVAGLDADLSSATVQGILDGLEPELRPLARPLMSWLALHFDAAVAGRVCSSSTAGDGRIAALLESAPQVAPRHKLYSMTIDNLTKHLQGQPLSGITYLNLHNCALRKLENLMVLRDLKVLVLCYNELQRVEGLSELNGLTRLDLAHNMLRKVEGLKGLTSLLHLDMSSNQVAKLEEVYGLKKYVPQLTYLDLSGNVLCEDKSYRPTVLRKMKHLVKFDRRDVTAVEKSLFGDNAGALTLGMVLEHGTEGHRFGVTDSAISGKALGQQLEASAIQELVLERKHIRRLQNLETLVNLRRASFVDNQISHIEGLSACTALEELCLEDNRIATIEGLQGLTRLKKLQLGKNRLTKLDLMSCVTNLTQLSVEDNELSTLSGIEPLVNLMELYAGNNRLAELREVQTLRELPKIIILDLSGNPCTAGSIDDYRLYVIYNVRKLKVLDGAPIDAAEQAAAKAKYSGRLTLDFLEQKLGHRMLDRIRDLDISNLKIRDVGTVFLGGDFERSLQELTLDGNLLVDVSGLALLRQLVVLKLNCNRLGEECTFSPQHMIERNPDLYRALTDPSRLQGQDEGQPAAVLNSFELFPYIQVLQLGGNHVASISSLQLGSLTSLRTLFLNNNNISRVDGLQGLANLQELVLDRNKIKYLDPDAFVGLPRLRELRLEENGLRSLANLHHLTSLQALHVSNNRITEIADLDRLSTLPNLLEVNLIGNAITRKNQPPYRMMLIAKCPRLYTADGQIITYEEREYVDRMFNQPLQGAFELGKPGQIAVRMTNVELGGITSGAQFSAAPAVSVPSIQSATIILQGQLGLEGMGLGGGGGSVAAGGVGAGGNAGAYATGPGMANGGVERGGSTGLGGMMQGNGTAAGGGVGAAGMGLGIGGIGYTVQGLEQGNGRDMWGRPTSNNHRGMVSQMANLLGAAGAGPRGGLGAGAAGQAAGATALSGLVNGRMGAVPTAGGALLQGSGGPTGPGTADVLSMIGAGGTSGGLLSGRAGPNASPARRQALMGRPQGGGAGGYGSRYV